MSDQINMEILARIGQSQNCISASPISGIIAALDGVGNNESYYEMKFQRRVNLESQTTSDTSSTGMVVDTGDGDDRKQYSSYVNNSTCLGSDDGAHHRHRHHHFLSLFRHILSHQGYKQYLTEMEMEMKMEMIKLNDGDNDRKYITDMPVMVQRSMIVSFLGIQSYLGRIGMSLWSMEPRCSVSGDIMVSSEVVIHYKLELSDFRVNPEPSMKLFNTKMAEVLSSRPFHLSELHLGVPLEILDRVNLLLSTAAMDL
jgi:hypothetical protein